MKQLPTFITQTLKQQNLLRWNSLQTTFWNYANQKHNIILTAAPGMGKTLVYLAYLTYQITQNPHHKALIVLPTYFLSKQISLFLRVCQQNGADFSFVNYFQKSFKANNFSHISLISPYKWATIAQKFQQINYLVIDEADMCWDQSFISDLKQGLKHTINCQKIAVSATLTHCLLAIKKYLPNAQIIQNHQAFWDLSNITHCLLAANGMDKTNNLLNLLKNLKPAVGLIFCNNNNNANTLLQNLKQDHTIPIKSLTKKTDLQQLHNTQNQWFVCTDAVARGLNLTCDYIIHFDLPKNILWYIHRSGRCGRYFQKGMVYAFYEPQNHQMLKTLQQKGIKWHLYKRNQNEWKESGLWLAKPFINAQLSLQIAKIKQKNHQRVKPNYKKKTRQQITRIIKQAKRKRLNYFIKHQSKTN